MLVPSAEPVSAEADGAAGSRLERSCCGARSRSRLSAAAEAQSLGGVLGEASAARPPAEAMPTHGGRVDRATGAIEIRPGRERALALRALSYSARNRSRGAHRAGRRMSTSPNPAKCWSRFAALCKGTTVTATKIRLRTALPLADRLCATFAETDHARFAYRSVTSTPITPRPPRSGWSALPRIAPVG
jgi:hypothetical protein